MDLEYWKSRALEAEQALKDAGGAALDTTKQGLSTAKDAATRGLSAAKDYVDPMAASAGAAVGKGVDATRGAASDLEALFLDNVIGRPAAQAPAPLPDDPMNQATPPHLRQFYGAEGNYGQPPEPAPEPGRMDAALKAAEEAFNSIMNMGGGGAPRPQGPMPPQFPGGSQYPAPGVRVPGR